MIFDQKKIIFCSSYIESKFKYFLLFFNCVLFYFLTEMQNNLLKNPPCFDILLFSKKEVIDKHFVSSDRGEYWKLLRPGTYELMARYENMESESIQISVEDNNVEIKDLILS